MNEKYIYIFVMWAATYFVRVLPFTLLRKPIKNQFFQSFLHYVPYVTLAVMTFPAIIKGTQSIYSGSLAFVVGIILSLKGFSLFNVAIACCVSVFILEMFI
ncbi:MAG: AzlD domain-containing protein [Phascolarctobacterium sp.]|nr:AzlD domain-containing protein [Phascolarctobacterium sp.]